MIKYERKKNKLGFSLLEIIVAVGIFGVIIILATGVFQRVIESQRSAIAAQNTQESVRFALEVMSKEMRSAKKRTADNDCDKYELSGNYKVYNTDGVGLFFRNKYDYCVYYFIENDTNNIPRLKIIRENGSDDYWGYITPDEVIISNLKFLIDDDAFDAFHATQPKVTIRMDVEAIDQDNRYKQPFKIQTTVSARFYE